MIDILMKAPLFQHVSSEAISGFLEKIPYRIESYQEHDIVALQGAPCNHLMVVLKGLLQGQMVNDAGKLLLPVYWLRLFCSLPKMNCLSIL